MSDLVQMNVSVDADLVKTVKSLTKDYRWSKRETVAQAIKSLRALMDLHEEVADRVEEPAWAEFYRRLAREAPVKLVEPKGSTQLGWASDQPDAKDAAATLDGWFIYSDPETGDLMAVDQRGRRGRYVGGDVVAFSPSPEEADLKPVPN